MQLVDKGSYEPWLNFDDFSLDADAIKEIKSRNVNLDGFASFHNKVVDRFYSLNFQVESEGTNFFAQKFTKTDVILIHPHPLMLFDTLHHISQFYCNLLQCIYGRVILPTETFYWEVINPTFAMI